MTDDLTSLSLLAAATECLVDNGYERVDSRTLDGVVDQRLLPERIRVFEDVYAIAMVVVYDTWAELSESWPDAQGILVELISRYVPEGAAKSWDGYLVLFALEGGHVTTVQEEASHIRYNTQRVRKLVATGADIDSTSDVERLLRPLLPLTPDARIPEGPSVLESLPSLLQTEALPETLIREAVDAYRESRPIVQAIYEWLHDAS